MLRKQLAAALYYISKKNSEVKFAASSRTVLEHLDHLGSFRLHGSVEVWFAACWPETQRNGLEQDMKAVPSVSSNSRAQLSSCLWRTLPNSMFCWFVDCGLQATPNSRSMPSSGIFALTSATNTLNCFTLASGKICHGVVHERSSFCMYQFERQTLDKEREDGWQTDSTATVYADAAGEEELF